MAMSFFLFFFFLSFLVTVVVVDNAETDTCDGDEKERKQLC